MVEKSIDITTVEFKKNISISLKNAFINAFSKAQDLFNNRVSRSIQPIVSNDIEIYIKDIYQSGLTNPENTKNIVDIRYCILNSTDLTLIPSDYSADSINLLGLQEMSKYLNYEVKEQGYIEKIPRVSSVDEKKLWIIGAVLGPLIFIILLFWFICFFYYKCVNPKKNKKFSSDVKSKRLSEKSLNSVRFFYLKP